MGDFPFKRYLKGMPSPVLNLTETTVSDEQLSKLCETPCTPWLKMCLTSSLIYCVYLRGGMQVQITHPDLLISYELLTIDYSGEAIFSKDTRLSNV